MSTAVIAADVIAEAGRVGRGLTVTKPLVDSISGATLFDETIRTSSHQQALAPRDRRNRVARRGDHAAAMEEP